MNVSVKNKQICYFANESLWKMNITDFARNKINSVHRKILETDFIKVYWQNNNIVPRKYKMVQENKTDKM